MEEAFLFDFELPYEYLFIGLFSRLIPGIILLIYDFGITIILVVVFSMHLQASFPQLVALGILLASTVALGQKIFELYYAEEDRKVLEIEQEKQKKL